MTYIHESDALEQCRALLRDVLGERLDDIALAPETSVLYDLDMESLELVTLIDELRKRCGIASVTPLIERIEAGEIGSLSVGELSTLLAQQPRH
jgi:acyl carrier protein